MERSESDGKVSKPSRKKGTVKLWRDDKGFGFIGVDGGVDHFFHYRSVADRRGGRVSFVPGDRVVFVPSTGPKGPRATEVRRAGSGGSK